MSENFDFAGDIELQLDATKTAFDTGWIAVLFDVPPVGEPIPISAGWLRASLSRVDEGKSKPKIKFRIAAFHLLFPVGERVVYRMPIVPNARRIAVKHRLRHVLASADEGHKDLALLGFSRTPSCAKRASIPSTVRRA